MCHPNPCENDGLCREIVVRDRYSKRHVTDTDILRNKTKREFDDEGGEIECICTKGFRGRRCSGKYTLFLIFKFISHNPD